MFTRSGDSSSSNYHLAIIRQSTDVDSWFVSASGLYSLYFRLLSNPYFALKHCSFVHSLVCFLHIVVESFMGCFGIISFNEKPFLPMGVKNCSHLQYRSCSIRDIQDCQYQTPVHELFQRSLMKQPQILLIVYLFVCREHLFPTKV